MTSYQLKCPECGALNRIPADKEGVSGVCGTCRAKLPPLYSTPRELHDADFDALVSAYPDPGLAEFWAPW